MWLCWPRIHRVEKASVVVSLTPKCVYTDTSRIQRVRVIEVHSLKCGGWTIIYFAEICLTWFDHQICGWEEDVLDKSSNKRELKVKCAKTQVNRWNRNHTLELGLPTFHLNWNAFLYPLLHRWGFVRRATGSSQVKLWKLEMEASEAVGFLYFIGSLHPPKYGWWCR